MRMPYDIIAPQVQKLIACWAMCSIENFSEARNTYFLFLSAVGWTDAQFDQETLKRIDANWDNTIWN